MIIMAIVITMTATICIFQKHGRDITLIVNSVRSGDVANAVASSTLAIRAASTRLLFGPSQLGDSMDEPGRTTQAP